MESWGDLKAAYRLFDREEVTFEAIARPHWERTRSVGPGRYLVLGDTTEIDFGYHRDIEGLSKIGNGSGRGFLLHNALIVAADSEALIGVAGQVIHYRQPAPKRRISRDDSSGNANPASGATWSTRSAGPPKVYN